MRVKHRYLATYNHQPVDRVPIALSYYSAGFLRKHFPPREEGQDPTEVNIQRHLRYGFDPHGTVRGIADQRLMRFASGEETPEYEKERDRWRLTEQVTKEPSGTINANYRIETPGSELTCVRLQAPDETGRILEPFIKEEEDINLLRHRPDPSSMVNAELIRQSIEVMGDRCWPMAGIDEVWGLASFLRGPARIMYDCFDRPVWVKRFMEILGEYQVELVEAIAKASSHLTLRINGSWIGFGLSRELFQEFIQPYDTRIVQAAHDAGLLVHLHICGKKDAFLEDLADMGIEALETLTPPVASGDVELGDVKRRIGDRVCLMGGFLSHLLTFGTPEDVETEVKVCLDNAARGGGYILSPTGRIDPETPEENLQAFTAAGKKYGVIPFRD